MTRAIECLHGFQPKNSRTSEAESRTANLNWGSHPRNNSTPNPESSRSSGRLPLLTPFLARWRTIAGIFSLSRILKANSCRSSLQFVNSRIQSWDPQRRKSFHGLDLMGQWMRCGVNAPHSRSARTELVSWVCPQINQLLLCGAALTLPFTAMEAHNCSFISHRSLARLNVSVKLPSRMAFKLSSAPK